MRYKRLTMGTSPASGELNKALRPLFQEIPNVFVIQDDVIVAGKTQHEHDETLSRVCEKIRESGMTLNPTKCLISKESIPWWGMVVSSKGISPDPKKVQSMKHITPPKSKDELKSFFCMIQSNKSFIHNLATKTEHMRKQLKKNVPFNWNSDCQKEFNIIKEKFTKDILLRHFNPKLETVIQVDAHISGISAILKQVEDGVQHIVAMASRATTPTEARYPQLDLEALAVDYGLRRYRFYIAGGPKTTIITDHKPLESIFKDRRSGSIRTERIKMRHQDMNYTVIWEKGEENDADYLSRHATPLKHIPVAERKETSDMEKTIWLLQYSPYTEAISIERLIEATRQDAVITQIKKHLKKGYMPNSPEMSPYKKILHSLTFSDSGLLMKDERIVLPQALIPLAIKKAHQGGHPGMTSMKRRLRSHFWFPDLNIQVEDAVKSCQQCAMFTSKNRKNDLVPQSMKGMNAWEKISVDLFGPMPDKRHIIVAQDTYSKFPAAKILNKTDSPHVTKALGEFYTSYGTPLIHRTDNGPPFGSEHFSDFSKSRGIQHEKSYPYHPQANPVETFMKPLGKTMKTAFSLNQDKEKALNDFLSSYRATPHSSTGIAPGDILFRHGYGNEFPRLPAPEDKCVRASVELAEHGRQTRDAELNLTRRKEEYQIGDQVMTRNDGAKKFDPKFGPTPMTVTTVERGGIQCQADDGTQQRRHLDDIKPFHAATNEATPAPTVPSKCHRSPECPVQTGQVEKPRRSNREAKPNSRLHDYHLY